EPMLKLAWEPEGTVYNRFEAKFGYTEFDSDETYLGLTEADFRSNPNRRYNSTRFDTINTEQYRTYLRHLIQPNEDWTVTSTGYFNYFKRAWYKLDASAAGGTFRTLSETLAGQHGAAELNVLKGTQAGRLRVRNNKRAYFGAGLDHTHQVEFETGSVQHTLEGGYRLHYDQAKRFQNDDIFTMDGGGNVTNIAFGPVGSQDNRLGESWAHAFHVQDTIEIGALTLTPGMRYEHVDIRRIDRRPGAGRIFSKSATHDLYAGGMGIGYQINDHLSAFGSAYRGFAIPDPNSSIDSNLGPEESLAAEVGMRYDNQTGFSVEGIFFTTFYSDLIVDSNAGGGGGGVTENAGDVDVYGGELAIAYDHGLSQGWALKTPVRVAFTYTDARFSSGASSIGGGGGPVESIFSGAAEGNRVPYIPEYQITATAGLEYDRYSLSLIGTYVPETFATGSNTHSQVRPDGVLDSRFGTTDSYFVMDLAASVQLVKWAKLLGGVKNITGDEYIVSRIPHGPRPGAPRLFYVGAEVEF
ncbi:MAG: TonB-dependent receptor family protein, partial [Candidatus Methylacidiphilales bacterium]